MPDREWITINIWDPVEVSQTGLNVEPLGDNLYRVADVPTILFGPHDVEYGDILELEPVAANTFEIRAVRQRGGWRRFDFLISLAWAASAAFDRLIARVEEHGGWCVQDFGGCLSIVFPPDSTWDPTDDVGAG